MLCQCGDDRAPQVPASKAPALSLICCAVQAIVSSTQVSASRFGGVVSQAGDISVTQLFTQQGPGFATIFRVYPSENLGVVVMGNDSTIDREALADVLAGVEW